MILVDMLYAMCNPFLFASTETTFVFFKNPRLGNATWLLLVSINILPTCFLQYNGLRLQNRQNSVSGSDTEIANALRRENEFLSAPFHPIFFRRTSDWHGACWFANEKHSVITILLPYVIAEDYPISAATYVQLAGNLIFLLGMRLLLYSYFSIVSYSSKT